MTSQKVKHDWFSSFYVQTCICDKDIKFYPIESGFVYRIQKEYSLKSSVEELEKKLILNSLIKHNWKKNKVIEDLKTTFPTLIKKMNKYKLEKTDK